MQGLSGGRRIVVVSLALLLFGCIYRNSRTVHATAYNSTPSQTHGNPNEGAWGDAIHPGMRVVAVSRDLEELGLERGTKVLIEGLPGTWTVLDRMHSRHRNRIDVYMGDEIEAAREWGVRDVEIRW